MDEHMTIKLKERKIGGFFFIFLSKWMRRRLRRN